MKGVDRVRQVNKAYQHLFNSPDGEVVMSDLQTYFGGDTLKQKDGVVDPHSTVAASGSRKVLMHIIQRIHANAVD
jgi:hypothetical protein